MNGDRIDHAQRHSSCCMESNPALRSARLTSLSLSNLDIMPMEAVSLLDSTETAVGHHTCRKTLSRRRNLASKMLQNWCRNPNEKPHDEPC